MSTLNLHIDRFFADIGEEFTPDILDNLSIDDCRGAKEGVNRVIEMSRGSKEGCIVSLRLRDDPMKIVVRVWTRASPTADRDWGAETTFPLTTHSEIIGGFMISRFEPLP